MELHIRLTNEKNGIGWKVVPVYTYDNFEDIDI